MSNILYYSNYCDNCKALLSMISRNIELQKQMHFLCVDKRTKDKNGTAYILLENGDKVVLPHTVTMVPALLLLNRGNQVLFGEDIVKRIKPQVDEQQQVAVKNNGEPMAFSIGSMSGGFGVASDSYSFLDQGADELSAKGTGGMRQTHHYSSVTSNDNIETPPDNYSADTIGNENMTMDKLQQQRAQEIHIKQK